MGKNTVVTCMSNEKAGKHSKGAGDHAMLSGMSTTKQWQFCLHDSDGDGGKWIGGGIGAGDLAAYDAEIIKLRAQMQALEKKLAQKQAERSAAATAGPGSTAPQSKVVSAQSIDPLEAEKRHYQQERRCCAGLCCILFGFVGAFLGDLIADEDGGSELTVGVGLDIVSTAERQQRESQNLTNTIDSHELHDTAAVEIGWFVGLVIGCVIVALLMCLLTFTWRFINRHKWQILFLLSLTGQFAIFALGFWRWIPTCYQDETDARINILNYDYDPEDRERLFLLGLFGTCCLIGGFAWKLGTLNLGGKWEKAIAGEKDGDDSKEDGGTD